MSYYKPTTFKVKTGKIAFLIVLTIGLFNSCNHTTERRIDKVNKLLPNGKHLLVEKTNEETTSVGVFSRHNYGTTHSFTYKILIDKGGINWDGGSAEPKHILFCEDTIFIRSLKEKYNGLPDSIANKGSGIYHIEIQESFQKLIDKRYFFKTFGDFYWVDVSQENYARRKGFCDEYQIPNDDELSLESSAKEKNH